MIYPPRVLFIRGKTLKQVVFFLQLQYNYSVVYYVHTTTVVIWVHSCVSTDARKIWNNIIYFSCARAPNFVCVCVCTISQLIQINKTSQCWGNFIFNSSRIYKVSLKFSYKPRVSQEFIFWLKIINLKRFFFYLIINHISRENVSLERV